MRDKQEILEEIHRLELKGPADLYATTRQIRLLSEILIDIRDAIITDCKDALNALIEIRKTKGGD